jgi:hypothetical protein
VHIGLRKQLYWDAGRFFDSTQGRKIIVLKLTAYLDESQVTENSKHVIVAGFYGESAHWNGLKDEWKSALKNRSLHMKDLRWGGKHADRRIKPLLEKLGRLPHEHKLTLIYGATKIQHYSDLLSNDIEKKAFSGYVVCFSQILGKLCVHLPAHASLRVVCEEQKVYQKLASKMFYQVAK